MEFLLNLAWAAFAVTLVTLWLRSGGRTARARRGQIVAIAVLIAILFPVISVSDDLMAIQSPCETSNSLRRASLVHPQLPAVAAAPPPAFAGIAFGFLRYVSPGWASVPAIHSPVQSAIQSRPPPQA